MLAILNVARRRTCEPNFPRRRATRAGASESNTKLLEEHSAFPRGGSERIYHGDQHQHHSIQWCACRQSTYPLIGGHGPLRHTTVLDLEPVWCILRYIGVCAASMREGTCWRQGLIQNAAGTPIRRTLDIHRNVPVVCAT